jgi:predicted PurR-regulated permease PerM
VTTPAADLERGIELAVRIGVLLLLLAGCLVVLAPFAAILGWAVVIAVALDPTYERLCERFDGRRKVAAAVVVVALLAVLVVPVVALSETLVTGVSGLLRGAEAGTLRIPAPPDSVAEWPVIGHQLAAAWSLAATNLEALLDANRDKVIALARWLVAQVASLGLGVLQILVAVVAAGFMLIAAQRMGATGERTFLRIAGPAGARFGQLAVATTRSVARGVLGVAFIQAVLAGLGLLVAGVPGAGLWTMVVLLLCVVQLGPALVLLPAAIYLFATGDALTASLFSAWAVFVQLIDNVLKPILLGRGVDVPMLVVVLGAIGGLLAFGVIGLFGGAIILVLGYAAFKAWLDPASAPLQFPVQSESVPREESR